MATAQEEAERLARFVDNLLDMTRLEAGALGPKREPVDVADAVGSALGRTDLLAGHRVETDLPANLPLLRADFVLLEQVLVNLLENAARYAPAGTPVEIAARIGDEAFLLEVRDRGLASPDEADASSTGSIARSTRCPARGWASVSPWPRASSRPWAAPSGPQAPGRRGRVPPELPSRAGHGCPWRGGGPCLIARPPCSSSTTSPPSDASSRARWSTRAGPWSRPPTRTRPPCGAPPSAEIILLDLGLPDRDGMALLELKRLSDATVLVLTSRDDERSKVAALDEGADDYVTKPFSIPELLARMRTALRRVQEQGGRPAVQAGGSPSTWCTAESPGPARRSSSRPRNGTSWSSWRSTPAAWSPTARSGQGLGPRHRDRAAISARLPAPAPPARARTRPPRWLVTEAGVGYRLMAEG